MKTRPSPPAESHQSSKHKKTLLFCRLTGFHELTLAPEHLRERAAAAGQHLLHGCGGEGRVSLRALGSLERSAFDGGAASPPPLLASRGCSLSPARWCVSLSLSDSAAPQLMGGTACCCFQTGRSKSGERRGEEGGR